MSQLDALLDRLTDLAAAAPEPSKFYRAILDAVITATQPDAAALWSVVQSSYRLEIADGLIELGIERDSQLQQLHESALAEVCRAHDLHDPTNGNGQQTPGHSGESILGDWTQRLTDNNVFRFFACRAGGRAFLAIELVFAAESAARVEAQQPLLSAIAEIALDFHNAMLLRSYEEHQRVHAQLESLAVRVHSHADLDSTAYEIVNEVRRFLGCDRVALVRLQRGRPHVLAVSAVSDLERRARQLRSLESLAASVVRSESRWHFPSEREEPPERSALLQTYLDDSRCERISIRALVRRRDRTDKTDDHFDQFAFAPNSRRGIDDVLGALVVEHFEPLQEDTQLEQQLHMAQPHVQLAFEKAIELDDLPLLKLSRSLRQWSELWKRRGALWLLGACVAAGLIGIAALIPADLNIPATGVFEPQGWQHIYAPLDGEIVEVVAAHQQMVAAGQPLLVLRSRELELKKEELTTQRSVSIEKLRGIEAARLSGRRPSSDETRSALELSASERELEVTVSSLDKQLVILEQMLSSLTINSPIAGQVVSWNTAANFERRPVQQGQRLMSLAAPEGSGRLQLRVADSDIRHVIAAKARLANSNESDGVLATFSIATNPGSQYTAQVRQVGTIVETVTVEGASVRVEAEVRSDQLSGTRPGATVFAKIHCGRSNLAYVWTRRLWDYILLHGTF